MKAPGFGDRRKAMLQDIVVLTGVALIRAQRALEKLEGANEDQAIGIEVL